MEAKNPNSLALIRARESQMVVGSCSLRSPVAKGLPMTSTIEFPIVAPCCPECAMPMRLARVIPSIVRGHAESQVFACRQCGAAIIRTVRSGQ
jgi:hypothetical protein